MSDDRITVGSDQIKNKLTAHWGKLSVEDLCVMQVRSDLSSATPAADSADATLAPGGLALARTEG